MSLHASLLLIGVDVTEVVSVEVVVGVVEVVVVRDVVGVVGVSVGVVLRVVVGEVREQVKVPEANADAAAVSDADEALHCCRSLRKPPGVQVIVFCKNPHPLVTVSNPDAAAEQLLTPLNTTTSPTLAQLTNADEGSAPQPSMTAFSNVTSRSQLSTVPLYSK